MLIWYCYSTVTALGKRANEKQITFCIDEVVREQFQTLCTTLDVSAANVMRKWIDTALENGDVNLQAAASGSNEPRNFIDDNDKKVIKNILSRLDEVERNTAYLNDNQMKFIKEEVLGDELGTLRNRMGVCEKELQQLGGNITRN
tara:strand:+ start:396 stop:830 length:435 start_codon:yes stop_codon:yes gene_type:complete